MLYNIHHPVPNKRGLPREIDHQQSIDQVIKEKQIRGFIAQDIAAKLPLFIQNNGVFAAITSRFVILNTTEFDEITQILQKIKFSDDPIDPSDCTKIFEILIGDQKRYV
jgi:hypothetical protein